jgi:glycosyltransferase involved in cell wall biosynthesis
VSNVKILIAHNYYQQRGGEDAVFENELRLLSTAGHQVQSLTVSNDTIQSNVDKFLTMLRCADNPNGAKMMKEAINSFRPDIVHVHNFFPLLSPAVYSVCGEARIPVVQTLHNFRPLCANGFLMRSGMACDLCVRGSPLWGVFHHCYRGSFLGSAALSRMIALHRRRKTWSTKVSRYIALTRFNRDILIRGGFPAERIEIKPNFVEDPGVPDEAEPRSGVFYAGRLSREKGLRYLLEAIAGLGVPLRIAGDGPERDALGAIASPNVEFLGRLKTDQLLSEMRRAVVAVMPSVGNEGFPVAIVEAFACATPMIVSSVGSLPEIVEDGVTGIHVPPADPISLAKCIRQLCTTPTYARQLGLAARQAYLKYYSPAPNLKLLESIYEKAFDQV